MSCFSGLAPISIFGLTPVGEADRLGTINREEGGVSRRGEENSCVGVTGGATLN